jgi:aspartokinase/homoserine dehydrogenase 1
MDVVRKALILAWGIGQELDLNQVQVESLIPQVLEQGTVGEFLEEVGSLDDHFIIRTAEARDRKSVLRYLATVDQGQCRVGLTEVPINSPLGRLSGNDNLLEIHSNRFRPTPLVIQGRGTGVRATTAGILSDIVELALIQTQN